MADNAQFSGGKLATDLILAMQEIAGRLHSLTIITDPETGLPIDLTEPSNIITDQLPAARGPTTKAGSLSITHATDDPGVMLIARGAAAAPVELTADSNQNLFTRIGTGLSGQAAAFLATNAATVAKSSLATRLNVVSNGLVDNGSDFEFAAGTSDQTVLASAARTATVSSDLINKLPRTCLHVVINVTALTAGASLVPHVRGKDSIAGDYYDILTGAAITATGKYVLKVGPGLPVAVNSSANDAVPRNANFQMVAADSKSVTYSVSAVLA